MRFIQLYHWGWDSHGTPTDEGLNVGLVKQCALTDRPTAALLADLKARGLLDSTLILMMGEFGRAPVINKNAGRDHWTFCYSMVMFGAGIKGGTIYGASDSQAAYVKDFPVSTGKGRGHARNRAMWRDFTNTGEWQAGVRPAAAPECPSRV